MRGVRRDPRPGLKGRGNFLPGWGHGEGGGIAGRGSGRAELGSPPRGPGGSAAPPTREGAPPGPARRFRASPAPAQAAPGTHPDTHRPTPGTCGRCHRRRRRSGWCNTRYRRPLRRPPCPPPAPPACRSPAGSAPRPRKASAKRRGRPESRGGAEHGRPALPQARAGGCRPRAEPPPSRSRRPITAPPAAAAARGPAGRSACRGPGGRRGGARRGAGGNRCPKLRSAGRDAPGRRLRPTRTGAGEGGVVPYAHRPRPPREPPPAAARAPRRRSTAPPAAPAGTCRRPRPRAPRSARAPAAQLSPGPAPGAQRPCRPQPVPGPPSRRRVGSLFFFLLKFFFVFYYFSFLPTTQIFLLSVAAPRGCAESKQRGPVPAWCGIPVPCCAARTGIIDLPRGPAATTQPRCRHSPAPGNRPAAPGKGLTGWSPRCLFSLLKFSPVPGDAIHYDVAKPKVPQNCHCPSCIPHWGAGYETL